MELSEEFLEKYFELEVKNKRHNHLLYPTYWSTPTKDLNSYVTNGYKGIDFLWQAIIFNLFIKLLFNYSPRDLKYCRDYIRWRSKDSYVDILPIYRYRFSHLVDDRFSSLTKGNKKKVYSHSLKKMSDYAKLLIHLFEQMEINPEDMIFNNSDPYFRSEFSDNKEDLSYIFYKTLVDLKI